MLPPRLRGIALAATCLLSATIPGCKDDASDDYEHSEFLARVCDDALDSVYEDIEAPSPWGPEQRGAIVRCAYDRLITVEEMTADFESFERGVPSLTTDVHKVRLLYFTERNGVPVPTSAAMYIPVERRGSPAPLLVLGHGSVGLADMCAPSREDPRGFERDWKTLAYTFAGDGWLSIQPDFPGLGTRGVTTWMYSEDEGHAMLDATRAARELMHEDLVADDNVLVGHSNGGHAALSAHGQIQSYGAEGTIRETLVYSPFWISNAAWGALASPIGAALTNDVLNANSMMYFYGHLDAYEGPDHALDAFLPEKREQVRNMFEAGCWQDVTRPESGPPSIGVMIGEDVFTDAYVNTVGLDCGLGQECDDPLAATWKMRWAADRPAPDPSVPIVQWTGALDDFVTPGYQQCGADRLLGQGGQLTQCVAQAGHSEILLVTADEVRAHLANLLLGEQAPPPCAGIETIDPPPTCNLPIANSSDPAEP